MEIFISAGEASGDMHGSRLARAISSISPETRLSCLGGPQLQASGASLVVDNRSISVVGISEVAGHAREIYKSWQKIRSHLLATRPELVVLIDFPDFNLLLGRFAKRIGCRVFFYISPQVWAWREGRVRTIKKLADRMAVILPFEKDFYASRGMEVDYVGHPLVDIMDPLPDKALCDGIYHDFEGPLVGLLPGSRKSEINRFFDILMESGRIISCSFPNARFMVPVAPSVDVSDIMGRAARRDLPVRVVQDDTYRVIRACDLILTASGTVTLEAAVLGTPMIVFYRVSSLSKQIAKLLIRAKFMTLPNLIAGKAIAPEFVQEQATAPVLAECAIRHLKNPALLDEQRSQLGRIRSQLGEQGVSGRVARLVLETAGGGR